MSNKRNFERVLTKPERRARAWREGMPDPVIIKREVAKRRWRRNTLIRKSGGLCEICGAPVTLKRRNRHRASIDHVVHRSRGGPDSLWNLRIACISCNKRRGRAIDQEYMKRLCRTK